jgi:hypothetical protein
MSPPPEPALPPLLAALLPLLAAHRPAFRQARPFERAVALVFGTLFAFARHTITQVLTALGQTEADWSAWYRLFSAPHRLDYGRLTACFLGEVLAAVPPDGPVVAVADGVQVGRHSRTMPGTAWLKCPRTPPFKPGPWRAQRFVHLAALLPRTPDGYSRALPLRWEPAFPAKAVPAADAPARREWEAGLAAIAWLRDRLDAAGRHAQRLLAVADSSYDVAALWAALPERVVLLARTARNRALYALPTPEKRRGAPRKYGTRAPTPAERLHERAGWRVAALAVRGRQVPAEYRAEGPFVQRGAPGQPVFLLVVKGVAPRGRHRRRAPAFWLVAAVREGDTWALPLPPEELLAWAWQRWEVEVAHRELKSGFGLGEVQCWGPRSAVLAVQWQAWAYGALVLAGYRAWGLTGQPLRPPGRWWGGATRWSLGTLWRGYRRELWGTAEFRALRAGTGAAWAEKAAWLAGLHNAAAGSLRA